LRLNILRCKKLNERGIYNLQGLTSYGLHNFKDELLNEFNNILFYDNTIQSKSQSIVHNKNSLLDWIAKHETIYLIIMETYSGN
jgi:hypothetical protein